MKQSVHIYKEYIFLKKGEQMKPVVKEIKTVRFEHSKDYNFVDNGVKIIFSY